MHEGGARANFAVVPNFNIPEYACVRPDDDALAELWMSITSHFPCPPQGHPVQERAIVVHDRRLADDDSVPVVDHDPSPESRRRVKIHPVHL